MSNLMLHAGAERATIEEVCAAPVPEPTETWYPVPYRHYLSLVRGAIDARGLEVRKTEFGLWGDEGDRMFGVIDVIDPALEDTDSDYSIALGVRASYNKQFANSLVAGSHVFVCDNLAFSGEVKMARKNTRYAMDELPRMIWHAMERVSNLWTTQHERFDAYRALELDDRDAHHLAVEAYREGAYPITYLADVLEEWHEPSHEEFAPRTGWSLFNGATEVLKRSNPLALPERTQTLHRVLDSVATPFTEAVDQASDELVIR